MYQLHVDWQQTADELHARYRAEENRQGESLSASTELAIIIDNGSIDHQANQTSSPLGLAGAISATGHCEVDAGTVIVLNQDSQDSRMGDGRRQPGRALGPGATKSER